MQLFDGIIMLYIAIPSFSAVHCKAVHSRWSQDGSERGGAMAPFPPPCTHTLAAKD